MKIEEPSIICSIDKDLNQLAGLHYDFVKDVMYEISEESANRFFYFQLLMGDVTDNITGIPGCGPKTATRILDGVDPTAYPQAVYEAYESYYGESQALEMMTLNGQLLWIKKKEGEPLWQPPKINIEADLNDWRAVPSDDPNLASTTNL